MAFWPTSDYVYFRVHGAGYNPSTCTRAPFTFKTGIGLIQDNSSLYNGEVKQKASGMQMHDIRQSL